MIRTASAFSALILAAGRPSPSLCLALDGNHPGRRPSAAFLRSRHKAFQHDYRFTDVFPLLAQIGEHLQNIHDGKDNAGLAWIDGNSIPILDKPQERPDVGPEGLR